MKTFDIYIIKKYLGTYFGAIILIVLIAVVFDLSEKMDEFLENDAPLKSIIFDYCLNFMPYFAVLFAPLFSFIAVIFFTSRMAYNTEIIAILSSGVSFPRLLVPYFISAVFIMLVNLALGNYVIPNSNRARFEFSDKYYEKNVTPVRIKNDIHIKTMPGVYAYLGSYNPNTHFGTKFSLEVFEGNRLKSKLFADEIHWDPISGRWRLVSYYIRHYNKTGQTIVSGSRLDTVIQGLDENEFSLQPNIHETMNLKALNKLIERQRMRDDDTTDLLIARHKRFSFPFSTLILTLIGVSVSSRKVRGGIGMHIGIGLTISFGYILFQQFSTQFATTGMLTPFMATWLPNFLFALVALFMYRIAPK